jgi:hypothetical protein
MLITAMACDAAWVLGVRQVWRSARVTDVWIDDDSQDVIPDPTLGFVRKPAIEWSGRAVAGGRYVHYRTDEHGFRNPLGLERADVVFIGDSFTEAGPLPEEETFVRRIEAASGVPAVNLGRSHYGAQQELIVLERYGLAYRPRAVVWVLFEGNDLADARRFAEWQRDPASPEPFSSRYAAASPILKGIRRTARRGIDHPRTLRVPGGGTQDVYLDYRYVPDAVSRDARGGRRLGGRRVRRALLRRDIDEQAHAHACARIDGRA